MQPGRERTPVILQMDSTECGAVVLAIMLAYFDRHLPISEIRETCDVTRDGSKAINLIKAARRYGLEAHGMQLDLDKIKLLPPPFIIYWQFNHFLIVEGFEGENVYLNDPATGPRTVTLEEFSQSYTGVTLFMNPGAEFQSGGQPDPGILKFLWKSLQKSRGSFIYIILVALGLSLPAVGLAFVTKVFFDNILLAGQRVWLPGVLLMILGLVILAGGFTWLKRRYLIRFYMKLKLTGSIEFFWKLLHLPMRFFQQRAPGDIAARVESHSYLADILSDKILGSLAGLISMVVLTLAMFLFNGFLAGINLFIALIYFILMGTVSRRTQSLGKRCSQAAGKLAAIEMNGLQIIETIKANAVEDQYFNYWASAHAEKISCEQEIRARETTIKIFPVLLQGLNFLILLSLGAWFILQDRLTPGGLLALQILLLNFNRPLMELLNATEHFNSLKGHVARMQDVNTHASEQILSPSTVRVLPETSEDPLLTLRHVEFGYSKLDPPILADLSLRVKAGERIALIGPSGGGKSSIAQLINGLYAPWSGEILLQGIPLAEISREELARFIACVDQQIFLFNATVRENLTLWNPRVSDAEIYHALNIAEIADVIRDRGGLSCRVEEFGRNFSGGQVQRLEIARALLMNPRLLILDEATSALDPIVEQQIYANLAQQQCTLLIIAHRLSAIRDCDQIVVIAHGRIIQQGTHDDLMEKSGLYQDLVSLEIQ